VAKALAILQGLLNLVDAILARTHDKRVRAEERRKLRLQAMIENNSREEEAQGIEEATRGTRLSALRDRMRRYERPIE